MRTEFTILSVGQLISLLPVKLGIIAIAAILHVARHSHQHDHMS